MIVTEYYMTRPDGVVLIRTYSNERLMIEKVSDGTRYAEAIDHYTYTFTVSEDATIAVTIGSVVIQNTFYRKANGSWTELSVATVYKKVDGAWVQQSDWANAFDPNTNYVYSSS